MNNIGLFITLYDEDTLRLYLNQGVYGFLMKPVSEWPNTRSRHFNALADYATTREGSHVFFFLKRKIIYGGQIVGQRNYGSFYINGNYSPLGRKTNADLVWDESERKRYESTEKKGVFLVPSNDGKKIRCQPYLFLFEDKLGLKGKQITSDDFYFELGKFSYPLPSNSIEGMSFCTLTPGETKILLDLISTANKKIEFLDSREIVMSKKPLLFDPQFEILSLQKAYEDHYFINEAHIEEIILANPNLLPQALRPSENTAICRQVPMSPFKPAQIDKADICYYNEKDSIRNQTIPNTIIELKKDRAGKSAIDQVQRYLKWLKILLNKESQSIRICILAPSYVSNILDRIDNEFIDQIECYTFNGEKISKGNSILK